MRPFKLAALLAAGAALLWGGSPAKASSHSDAPLIKLDPQANLTDLYAFIREDDGKKVLYVVVNCRPFSNPGDGVSYEKFSDDALYSIHITDPATGATRIRYNFRFSPVSLSGYKNLDTILNYGRGADVNGAPDAGSIQHVGDNHQNYTQTYTVTRVTNGLPTPLNEGMTLMCPPANVGARTTPYYDDADGRAISGATSRDTLDRYTKETVYDLPSGETVFCGSREDSFYADTPGIFDLLNPRILNSDHKGVDDFKGYNVLTYAIEIPVDKLGLGNNPVVGVYASVSRPHIQIRNQNNDPIINSGWVQVNRLGNPLFNEVLVAIRDKDRYNRTSPTDDAQYAKYAENPEVAFLINAVYGTNFAYQNRTDLRGIFIPDVLRVDTSTGAVPIAGEPNFNRLSIFGGDTVKNGQGQDVPSGWPNGRRLGDDVVDIALTAIATDLRTPIGPNHPVVPLGDNVDHNDQVYNQTFPYAATPHSGTYIRHDPEM